MKMSFLQRTKLFTNLRFNDTNDLFEFEKKKLNSSCKKINKYILNYLFFFF